LSHAGRGPAAALAWGLGVSVAIHLVGFLALSAVQAPSVDVELSLPDQVAFGLTEEVEMAPPAAPEATAIPEPPAPPPPVPDAPDEEPAADGDDGPGDAGPPDAGSADGGIRDAGPPDAGVDAGLGTPSDAGDATNGGAGAEGEIPDGGVRDAAPDGGDGGQPDAGGRGDGDLRRPGVARAGGDGQAAETVLPAGAQLALRLDLRALRASSLREPVAALLEVLPDWRALLEGSGVEPLSDLDRLLLASPNLRRSRTLVAGRTLDGDETVRRAVAQLAAHRGQEAPWRTRLGGVPVAPWHDRDRTVREVALLGGGVFAITRPEDLPALLAVARARAGGDDDDGGSTEDGAGGGEGGETTGEGEGPEGTPQAPSAGPGSDDAPSPAEALLALPGNAVLSFEAEGARAYVSGGQATIVPERLSLTVVPAGGELALAVTGRWPDAEEAEAAESHWGRRIRAYAGHPLAGLFGVAGALQRTELDRDGRTLRARTTATPEELERVLRQARGFFAGPPRPPPSPRVSGEE